MPITLIVEDGTRPTGANTYASVATADAYHADRAFAAWDDATADEKATALIKATSYLNGLSWQSGEQVGGDEMAWPRVGAMARNGVAYSSSSVPRVVVLACCHLAGEVISGADLSPIVEREITEITVGPIGTKWAPGSNPLPRYPAVESLLRGLIGAQNVVRLVAG